MPAYKKNYLLIKLLVCGLLFCCFSRGQCWSQEEPSFQLIQEEALQTVSVSFSHAGIWEDLIEKKVLPREVFQVFVGNNQQDGKQAIMGSYALRDGSIAFHPAFPLQPGIEFVAVFMDKHHWSFQIPEKPLFPQPAVTAIYPSGDTLPANLLKLYLHFATPMGVGNAYQYIHLTNSNGDTLSQAILELQPELWDENRQRLTLWFDPGRVKRALGPNELKGAPLQEGKWYTLHLDPSWEDARSHSLSGTFKKTFYVSSPDRRRPQVNKWKLVLPESSTMDPLEIKFGEPLDQALALHSIKIIDPYGKAVEGQFSLEKAESVAGFRPSASWIKGCYRIEVKAILEDLAGNNLNRLFDRDLAHKDDEVTVTRDFHQLTFEIK